MNKQQLLKLEPHRLIEVWKFEVKRTSNRDDLNMTYHCGWFTMSGHSKMRKPRVCDAILALMNRPDYTEPKPETNPYSPTNRHRPPYHWISVEDELPEINTARQLSDCVLTIVRNQHNKPCVSQGFYDSLLKKWRLYSHEEWKVTHWQYLPALPE